MKNLFFILMFSGVTLLNQFSFAQNLVPNPSFEDTVTCPHSLTQIDRAVGWSSYRESPDYFNYCDPPGGFGDVSVPENSWGYQYPRSGNAYAGLGTLNPYVTSTREYMGVQLIQPLSIGHRYFASFYAVRAKSINPYINIATNKIGIRLSTIAYSQSAPIPIDNFSQVFADSIITDTVNWAQISGAFIADSAYQFLSIGNFFNDSLTSYIAYDTLSSVAYYYIDDVSLLVSDSSTEGISDHYEFESIKVFPNPARDWIVVEGRGICKLSLYDVLGKLCFSKVVLSSPLTKINVSAFNRGMYFLNIVTSSKNFNQKIIVK